MVNSGSRAGRLTLFCESCAFFASLLFSLRLSVNPSSHAKAQRLKHKGAKTVVDFDFGTSKLNPATHKSRCIHF